MLIENDFGMELTGNDSPTPEPAPAPAPADPALAPKPDETSSEKVESEPVPVAEPVKEGPLFETPDGRKVDAATLTREWKENFLPEFTRKSQELAKLKEGPDPITKKEGEPAWKNPDYVPENYAEVIEFAKQEALAEIRGQEVAEARRVAAVKAEVDAQMAEIKAVDPSLDENQLFAHANKYGFRDLKMAHGSLTDFRKAVVDAEQRAVKNIKSRDADPIATAPNANAAVDTGYDPVSASQFDSAADYLAHLNAKK